MKVIKANDPFVVVFGKMSALSGSFPYANQVAPDFTLLNASYEKVTQAQFLNKTLLIYTNPSVDTPIAANVLRLLEEKSALWQKTAIISVSEDLPFALSRLAKWEGLNRVQLLSSYRSDFPENYGVRVSEGILQGLLAPALLIIEQGKILYAERMVSMTDEPNYEIVNQYCR